MNSKKKFEAPSVDVVDIKLEEELDELFNSSEIYAYAPDSAYGN
jgi:hypothetical protein